MLRVIRPAFGLSTSRKMFPKNEQFNTPVRKMWGVPPNQYDVDIPKRLRLGVLWTYFELIPLFAVTILSFTFVGFSIFWAVRNKVDAVFSSHSRDYISRTMNLYHPTNHKLILINQKYEPWPEMQKVLDKMVAAEKRLAIAAGLALSCYPK